MFLFNVVICELKEKCRRLNNVLKDKSGVGMTVDYSRDYTVVNDA